jgi:Type IV secretion-system coupling protein DNA-binding domain
MFEKLGLVSAVICFVISLVSLVYGRYLGVKQDADAAGITFIGFLTLLVSLLFFVIWVIQQRQQGQHVKMDRAVAQVTSAPAVSASLTEPETATQQHQTVSLAQTEPLTPAPLQPTPATEKEKQQESRQQDEQRKQETVPKDAVILGRDEKTSSLVTLSQATRRQGMHIIGSNGTGKSTLIANLIAQDMEQGFGVGLLDPHGDLTRDVLSRVPDNRIEDVILLDLMDSSYPFGLNLFQCPDITNTEKVAVTVGFVMHVFEKVWDVGTQTPQLAQVLRNVTVTLIENQGMTFTEIPLLLQDETVRAKLIKNVKNNQVRLFWTIYNNMRASEQLDRVSSILNKVDALLIQPIIANIVGQSQTTIDFRKIMDEGKILLVQLSPQLEDISSLVGAVIMGQLLNAALSRKDIPEEQRRQFNLYADEYQRFATEDFATLLSEARKFGIATTIAYQTLSQLDLTNRGSSLNAATKFVFRVTGDDGKELAREYDHTPPPPQIIGDEPVRAPTQNRLEHLLEKDHPKLAPVRTYADMENEIASKLTNLPNHQAKVKTLSGEYTLLTLPPTTGVTGQALDERRVKVREQTRKGYCKPRLEVEQEIAARQAFSGA